MGWKDARKIETASLCAPRKFTIGTRNHCKMKENPVPYEPTSKPSKPTRTANHPDSQPASPANPKPQPLLSAGRTNPVSRESAGHLNRRHCEHGGHAAECSGTCLQSVGTRLQYQCEAAPQRHTMYGTGAGHKPRNTTDCNTFLNTQKFIRVMLLIRVMLHFAR